MCAVKVLHYSKQFSHALERDELTSRETNLKRVSCKALTEPVPPLAYVDSEARSSYAYELLLSPFCESLVKLGR